MGTDRRTEERIDGRTELKKQPVAYHNFANAPDPARRKVTEPKSRTISFVREQAAFKCSYTRTGITICHIPVFWRVRELTVYADRKTDTQPQSYAGRLEFWRSRTNNQNYSPCLKFKAINILNMSSRITQTTRFLNWYRSWTNAKFIISRVIQVTTS
jgi:hypothetical protein